MVKDYFIIMMKDFFSFHWGLLFYSFNRWLSYVFRRLENGECEFCGGATKVYFLRSHSTMKQGQDDMRLYDWVVCQNKDCKEVVRFNGP